MDFKLSAEEQKFAEGVRAFLDKEAQHPDAAEFMAPDRDAHSQLANSPERREFCKRMGAQGYLGMSWPKEFGGQEIPGIFEYLLNEELALRGAPLIGKGVGCIGKTIIRHGSEEMKKRFLPLILDAEAEFALGYSEPGSGSDLASLKLKAEPDGDGWVLNGQKVWTTSANFAEWYWVAARTDPDAPKHKGISVFLIPMDHPGLTVRPIETMGHHRTNEVFFDNVRIGPETLVGELNKGWTYVCEALDFERFTFYTVNPLLAKFERAVESLRTVTRNGVPLAEDAGVKRQIGRLGAEVETAKMLQRRVVDAAAKGEVPAVEAAMYKVFSTRLGQLITDFMLDHLGATGLLRHGAEGAVDGGVWEHFYQTTPLDTIGGGTSEVQKNIIARRGLGLPLK
ncbi:MAG: acyl-CoA dehydrogenase family protein [Novosphingobium sp.]|nr:acyl-CoA dehydrogenase family protein [Novosphingobium sp.]